MPEPTLTDEVELIRAVLRGYPQSMARSDAERACNVIERALNQRLAVKEGEAVGYKHTLDNTEGIDENEPWVCFSASPNNPFGVPGEDYSATFPWICEPLYTHPVSDDQQAKDAALRQARDCINIVWVSHHANRCDAAIAAIDAALSATKQEEV